MWVISNLWSFLCLLCSFESSWLQNQSKSFTPCDSVHTSLCMRRSVWGPLCFSAYAYLVTPKMVSRLCVSLCEAGVESSLFICPPVCLQYIRRGASILTSSLRSRISLLQHGGQRGSQNEQRPRYETAELTGISPAAGCNIPFVRGPVRWGSSCGSLSKGRRFWALRWIGQTHVIGGYGVENSLNPWLYKQESLLEWERDRQREKNRCPGLHWSCYLLVLSAVGGKFEGQGPKSSQTNYLTPMLTVWKKASFMTAEQTA